MQGVRWMVILPTFVFTVVIVLFGLMSSDWFEQILIQINQWILHHFGWLFSLTALIMVLLCILAFVAPIGRVRIGGEQALPILDKKRVFAITLCTTIASGILFWGTAEPMIHLQTQAQSRTVDPSIFALSTMYLHWSFIPYAIYAVPTLLIALAIYNHDRSNSVTSLFFPLGNFFKRSLVSKSIDTLCLFCLVAGMSASLGTVMLAIIGGVETFFDIQKGWFSFFSLGVIMVFVFVLSSISGLHRGIKYLSTINTLGFMAVIIFVFFTGFGFNLIPISLDALRDYVGTFFHSALLVIIDPSDPWSYDWTVFYWAVWMAWAPISAIFLGRICKGYTVRMLLLFNWLLPSIFTVIWMSIFSGTSLLLNESTNGYLMNSLSENGAESVLYSMIGQLPLAPFITVFFILLMFLSFITSADSNTTAMASVSSTSDTSSTVLKVFWGGMIGLVACIMVSLAGVEGIKMISNLGGLPALFIMILACISLIVLLIAGYGKETT